MTGNTPNPTPSRANYGFALYLASYSAIALYLVWIFLPTPALEYLGLAFLPQKYWALAVPVHACVTLAAVTFVFYPALNMTLQVRRGHPGMFTDPYARYETVHAEEKDAVPPMYDIPATIINPQHVVPTLVDDDGYVIWESRAIAKYLVEKYAIGSSLYPSTLYERLEVDKILDFDLGSIFRRSTDYFVTVLLTGKFDPSKRPKLDDALEVLDVIIKRKGTGFVASENLTIADISLLTTVTSLEVVGYDLNPFKYITKWLTTVKNEIPNYNVLGIKGEKAFKSMVDEKLTQ